MITKHPLHKLIGAHIKSLDLDNVQMSIDPACGGDQNIPLFMGDEPKSNGTEICNVDILIIKNDLIQIIIEIEETNIKPTQILGKFGTSLIAKYHSHYNTNSNKIMMSNDVLFIQILDKKTLKAATSKIDQGQYIQESISRILPSLDSNIKSYRLIYGDLRTIDLIGLSSLIIEKLKITS